ncbi:hypothetical protein CKU_0352 [Staphylococcus aureus]|nr:hypothetical protein CKU_0352 [Staphylococcus aureus]
MIIFTDFNITIHNNTTETCISHFNLISSIFVRHLIRSPNLYQKIFFLFLETFVLVHQILLNVLNDLIKYSVYIYDSNKIDCESIYEIENFLTSNIRVDLETELFKDTLLEDSNLSDYIKNQLLTIWRD